MTMNTVTVVEYGGKHVEKVLVEDKGDVLLVTTPQEWNDSQRESREPIVVGFRREYLVR